MYPSLQICIPTYNRFEKLKNQILKLIPQMGLNDIIIVVDNNSTDSDFSNVIFKNEKIKVVNNESNIGICGNITKCFDYSFCDWVWVLSDDDAVKSNAVEIIKKTINNNDVKTINFSSSLLKKTRQVNKTYTGVDGYLNALDSFSNQLLISNNIYCRDIILESKLLLTYGNNMSAPHIVPIITAAMSNNSGLLSLESIVDWGDLDVNDSWSRIALFNSLTLIDLLDDFNQKRKLFHLLANSLPRLHILASQLSYSAIMFDQKKISRLFFSKVGVYFLTFSSPLDSMMYRINYLSLFTPKLTLRIYSFIYKMKNKKELLDRLQARRIKFFL